MNVTQSLSRLIIFDILMIALLREFVNKHYVQIKQANPKTPILIRECSGVQPRLWARYGTYLYDFLYIYLEVVFFLFCFRFGEGKVSFSNKCYLRRCPEACPRSWHCKFLNNVLVIARERNNEK